MLRFRLKNAGDDLDWVDEQARKRGVAPPQIDRPQLRDDLLFYWTAFNELCTERNSHGFIPLRAVRDYAQTYHVSYEAFKRIMLAMDQSRAEAIRGRRRN